VSRSRTFTAFWLHGDHVLAAMHANDWDATDHLRRLVGRRIDTTRLRDESVPLESLSPAD
jgi:3-phenylpropionate/trans-cinnamate dioxygenase ferredoxin reductase subunit